MLIDQFEKDFGGKPNIFKFLVDRGVNDEIAEGAAELVYEWLYEIAWDYDIKTKQLKSVEKILEFVGQLREEVDASVSDFVSKLEEIEGTDSIEEFEGPPRK